jgi:hypothetical protein
LDLLIPKPQAGSKHLLKSGTLVVLFTVTAATIMCLFTTMEQILTMPQEGFGECSEFKEFKVQNSKFKVGLSKGRP